MKKTTRLLLAAGVLLLAAGCKDSDEPTVVPPPDGTQFSETFIQQYLAPSGIELSARTINDPSTTCIHVRFDGELYTPGSEQFATLSEAYGDTSYNNPLVPFSNLALAETIRAVSVRWTPRGAAADGTRTLDAVTHIGTASLYAFVRNGYRDDAEAFPDALSFLGCYQQYGHKPVYEPVGELDIDDTTLIAYEDCNLLLPAAELASGGTLEVGLTVGTHTFTATLALSPAK